MRRRGDILMDGSFLCEGPQHRRPMRAFSPNSSAAGDPSAGAGGAAAGAFDHYNKARHGRSRRNSARNGKSFPNWRFEARFLHAVFARQGIAESGNSRRGIEHLRPGRRRAAPAIFTGKPSELRSGPMSRCCQQANPNLKARTFQELHFWALSSSPSRRPSTSLPTTSHISSVQ